MLFNKTNCFLLSLAVFLLFAQSAVALIDPNDLSEMKGTIITLSNNSSNLTCNPCSEQLLPFLNDMCWKYNVNTREQIVSFLSISIENTPNQKLLNAVIVQVAPTIVELKKASQVMEETKTALLSNWISNYGSYPQGNGQPIERVIALIVTRWANPSTTLHTLLNTSSIRHLLNARPASADLIMFSLMNYLNSLHNLAYGSMPICSKLECH